VLTAPGGRPGGTRLRAPHNRPPQASETFRQNAFANGRLIRCSSVPGCLFPQCSRLPCRRHQSPCYIRKASNGLMRASRSAPRAVLTPDSLRHGAAGTRAAADLATERSESIVLGILVLRNHGGPLDSSGNPLSSTDRFDSRFASRQKTKTP
jgi:hypothetical protein